jgi:predicted deacylase
MALQVGDVRSEPGTKRRGFVKVLTTSAGGDLALPVHIVTGAKPGPTLCLTAAMHGDQTDSIVNVMAIVQQTDVQELAGTILAVPVTNPPAFEAGTFHTPIDGVNLEANAFPGFRNGSTGQQIAYTIATEILTADRVDAHIDVHAPPVSMHIELGYDYMSPGAPNEELTLVQGYEVNYRGAENGLPGSLVQHSIDQGIPVSHSNGRMVDLENVMKHLGMIDGDPILPDRQFITGAPRHDLRPRHGGMLMPEFSLDEYPDQIVPEGTLMARVVNPYTFEELERLVAPFEGAVFWWRVGNRKCNPGEYAYSLGRMDDAEWIRGGT